MYHDVCEILSKRDMLGKMNSIPIFGRYNITDTGTKLSKQLSAFKGNI